jgi:hypothetical protein
MFLNKTPSPTPTAMNKQHIWGGYSLPADYMQAQDAPGGPPTFQQGIIASDFNNLFYPVHINSPS